MVAVIDRRSLLGGGRILMTFLYRKNCLQTARMPRGTIGFKDVRLEDVFMLTRLRHSLGCVCRICDEN
jgi:hypothetical protein